MIGGHREERRRRLLLDVAAACAVFDEDGVVALLDAEAVLVVDGGGLAGAAVPVSPVFGGRDVARALIGLQAGSPRTTAVGTSVNGEPGIVLQRDGVVVGALTATVRAGRLLEVWLVVNPDKLRHWRADAG